MGIPTPEDTTAGFPHRTGADLAGAAILLELAARLGILSELERGGAVSAADITRTVGATDTAATAILRALFHAGLVEEASEPVAGCKAYRATERLSELKVECGYVAWGLHACSPFLDHAPAFLSGEAGARDRFPRDGRVVAVASSWIGAADFYPATLERIRALAPKTLVDLGAGSARLLIDALLILPDAVGVGIDISKEACALAVENGTSAGIADRLRIEHRSVESLVDDASILEDADVINAGFVLHDLVPEQEDALDAVLRRCCVSLSKREGTMLITEVVPYASGLRERVFSAAFTLLHEEFMGRRVQTPEEWERRLLAAGFAHFECVSITLPGARLYVAATGSK